MTYSKVSAEMMQDCCRSQYTSPNLANQSSTSERRGRISIIMDSARTGIFTFVTGPGFEDHVATN